MALPELLDPVYVGDPLPAALNEARGGVNALTEEIQKKISHPPGAATGDLLRWDGTQWVTTDTRFFEGTGRPDGNIAAPVGSRYVDKNGTNGAVEWTKRAGGDTNQGWICLAGDTNLLDISSIIDIGNGTVHEAVISRHGHTVDFYLDVTMPTNKPGTWALFSSIAGFGPGMNRYGVVQPNNEAASTYGTLLNANAGLTIIGIVGGKRDRFSGSWVTRYGWPVDLPGPVR